MEEPQVDLANDDNERGRGSEGAALKDWLYHTNNSLSRLKDVKQSTYRLGGGPKEREKNWLCNHRSKNGDSYLNAATIPPELSAKSQETASIPDTSVPELLKQFHERQKDTKVKRWQRPHTATSCSSQDVVRNSKVEQKAAHDRGAFIAVKGCTVAPKPRPASGSATSTLSVTSDSSYKGLVRLDPQHVEETKRATIEGFRKYSAAFAGDDDVDPTAVPSAPRASPEPNDSPEWGGVETMENPLEEGEEFFSEDEDSVDGSRETESTASRPLVFEIPTADVDYVSGDDDDESVSATTGRFSTDYVAKSREFLQELTEKNKRESEELEDMISDMEQTKNKISQLRISPRDLEELEENKNADKFCEDRPSSLSVVNMQFDRHNVPNEFLTEGSTIETLWVEDHGMSGASHVLPTRTNRIRSAPGRDRAEGAQMRRQMSDDAMVLRGQTMSFLNAEDIAVGRKLQKSLPRRSTEPPGSLRVLRSDNQETRKKKREGPPPAEEKKVTGRPPRPNTALTKKKRRSKEGNSRGGSREVASDENSVGVNCSATRTPNPGKSSLKKCSSEGSIPKSVEECGPRDGLSTSKKTVSFSREVVPGGRPGSAAEQPEGEEKNRRAYERSQAMPSNSCAQNSDASSCGCGIVIEDGFEVKTESVACVENEQDVEKKPRRTAGQIGDNAKLLAQVKAATRCSCFVEECACRGLTRPTMGVISDAKAARTGAASGLRLLKQRPSRPSSAPIRRAGDGVAVSGAQSKPRLQSAHKRTGSEGSRSRPRPISAHIRRPSNKEARRNQAAVKALKEGYLFKEKPVPTPVLKSRRKIKEKPKSEGFEDVGFVWGQGEDDVAPSEECEDVYARLNEKGINVSMDTIKRGLMAPARRASELCMTSLRPSSSSGLLSRPEKWLPEEYARIKVWEDVSKHAQ